YRVIFMKIRRSLWSRMDPFRVTPPKILEDLIRQLGSEKTVVKLDQKLGSFPEDRYLVKTKDGRVIIDYFAPIGSRRIKIHPDFLPEDFSEDYVELLNKIKNQNLVPHFVINFDDLRGEDTMHDLIMDMMYLAAENLQPESEMVNRHVHLNPQTLVYFKPREEQSDFRSEMSPRYFLESKQPGYVPDAAI
ncbi:hypothetical protein KY328_02535, partial [Candidatus Woesearchaeota archaeon]|nr:hypothetical protein [Candidatus Woesearchaeota archaeon]